MGDEQMNDDRECDESRLLRGPRALEVYVPPRPLSTPEDIRRDFPPGDPPEVHYLGVTANYWEVLREGRMPYWGGTKVFPDEVMQWLRGIREDVERLIAAR
jgi:hypothetical protein